MSLRFLVALLAAWVSFGVACHAPAEDGAAAAAPPKAAASAPKGKAKTAKASASKGAAEQPTGETAKTRTLEKATFGGGCFWCIEAVFEQVKGVKSVVSGYAGGSVPRPYYELVGTGTTGHAEVVQIEYDADIVTYDDLLKTFWSAHDPTTLNRQGPDEGTQYRSLILYHNDEQKLAAQKMYNKLTAAHVFAAPITTQLAPLTRFYPAERYHQNYYRNHRFDPYCEAEIAPKLQMMKLKQAMERRAATSTDKSAGGDQ
ncbi:MAG: peptide-methionine (S)-S-oxide reductase MsrA [Isosphaeraceae bacterium]|nr:peptide-methionine (S)-S-oxide reductase MsrA [Isosphaeraceae bacterium]